MIEGKKTTGVLKYIVFIEFIPITF